MALSDEDRREVQGLIRDAVSDYIDQQDIPAKLIKQRHTEANMIFFGLAANRPDGSTEVKSYFATNTAVLSVWDGSAWVDIPRIPASPGAYTQTYSTADRTHENPTATAVGDLVATDGGWGYSSEANADAVHTAIDALIADVADVKQLLNSVIDDLQSIGLVD